MEGRLRKRSWRPSESGIPQQEPPKKKSKRQETPVEGRGKTKKSKSGKNSTKHSPQTKKVKCVDSNSPSEAIKRGRRLLVSLNIQDNDLLVCRTEKLTTRTKAKGRSIQRSESVEVGNDSSGSGSGRRSLNFKNSNFTVSMVL